MIKSKKWKMKTRTPTIKDVLLEIENHLKDRETVLKTKILLMHLNNINNFSEFELKINQEMRGLEQFRADFARLLNGEPVQYIINEAVFHGHKFYVDQRVLIPRPETEELTETIIKDINKEIKQDLTIVDVGTGSGVIGLTIKKRYPKINLICSDISKEALEVARKNADKLGISAQFIQGDRLTPVIANKLKVDIIVFNMPYIKKEESVAKDVVNYEPHQALFSPSKEFLKEFLIDSLYIMKKKITIYLEFGENQKNDIEKTIHDTIKTAKTTFFKDLQGKDRYVRIIYEY